LVAQRAMNAAWAESGLPCPAGTGDYEVNPAVAAGVRQHREPLVQGMSSAQQLFHGRLDTTRNWGIRAFNQCR